MPESPRALAFRDIFVWELQQTLASRFATFDNFVDRFVFPDLTTQVLLTLSLNQTEWTKLYSAVLTGADLTYPDQSHDVEYLFLQMVSADMADICAVIAECISSSANTQAALAAFLAAEGMTGGVGDPDAPVSDGSLSENLLPDGYTCTDDKAFGMALAIVDSIHSATEEVLQAIELLTNPLELASELADNVPGVGALAMGVDTINWIQDTAQEEYVAAWSAVVRDELACLLWCEIKDDCYLSFDTIWHVYLDASGTSPPSGDTLEDWLDWLFGLPLVSPLATVATVSLLGLLAMRYGGRFGEFYLGVRSLRTVIALAQDDTSSDWSTVCDVCPPTWCYAFDFSIEAFDWTIASGFWGQEEDDEWGIVSNGSPQTVDISHAVNGYVTRVVVRWAGVGGGSSDFKVYADGDLIHDSTLSNGDHTIQPYREITTLRIYGTRQFQFLCAGVSIAGTGDDPEFPEGDACPLP